MSHRRIGSTDVAPIALRAKKTAELLMAGHDCRRHACIIGEHVWHTTKDMSAGPRAHSTDPNRGGWRYEEVVHPDGTVELMPVAIDAVGEAAVAGNDVDPTATYARLLAAYEQATDDLDRFLQAHRPDRHIPRPDTASAEDWCRNHLDTIGVCEPRYRGDQCRWCYEARLAYDVPPPATLLRMRHEGDPRWRLVYDEYMSAAKKKARKRRKKR